jgi:hypothetical protein
MCHSFHMKKRARNSRRPANVRMTIGRERFAKISAVEGVELTLGMRKRVAEFDRRGLPPAERRRAIIRAHSGG